MYAIFNAAGKFEKLYQSHNAVPYISLIYPNIMFSCFQKFCIYIDFSPTHGRPCDVRGRPHNVQAFFVRLGRPMDVPFFETEGRTKYGRPMDVSFSKRTDGPNSDVPWTSFGRPVPILNVSYERLIDVIF